jgi:hypothetical protein
LETCNASFYTNLILAVYIPKEGEAGRACTMCGSEVHKMFRWVNLKQAGHDKDIDVNGRIILQ